MLITIADDGMGMEEHEAANALSRGIGVRNVNERLKVMYGPENGIELRSRPGEGTEVRIVIPTEGSDRIAEAVG
jgi:sensor histidine kinase YesM